MFGRSDFKRRTDQLRSIKGAFMLSINDKPAIREVFAGFEMDEVRLTYTAGRSAPAGKSGELIVSNRSVAAGLL